MKPTKVLAALWLACTPLWYSCQQKSHLLNQDQTAISDSTYHSVELVERYGELTAFDEVMQLFPDQLVYVIFWKSTCEECTAEFSSIPELSTFAQKNGIVPLYISLDRDSDAKLWEETIEVNELPGKHIRANRQLAADIRERFEMESSGRNTFQVPFYIILKNGKIVKLGAESPRSKKRLQEQLQSFKIRKEA